MVVPPETRWYKRLQEAMMTYAGMAAEEGVRLHLRFVYSLSKPNQMGRIKNNLEEMTCTHPPS